MKFTAEKPLRIGTRCSELALWQARQVQNQLSMLGVPSELVPLKSQGDVLLHKPLYELGITGVFTRHLDAAMLAGNIDIAVHSMKDVPTRLPQGIVQAAVLPRGNHKDILVFQENVDDVLADLQNNPAVIATSSPRRAAQWLNRYPHHQVVDLRGNVQTRLQKLKDNGWNGAIFAAAGLERLGLRPAHSVDLAWMIPAPAQGVIMVTAKADDSETLALCKQINHIPTALCSEIERDFLYFLEGGCTAPIGAFAHITGDELHFQGVLLSQNGKQKLTVERTLSLRDPALATLAQDCAAQIRQQGGVALCKARKPL